MTDEAHTTNSEANCGDALKLWIVDVNRITSQETKSTFTFRGISVQKVDISGVVRNYDNSKPTVVFTVDDGTGTVTCTVNYETLKVTKDQEKLKILTSEINELQMASAISQELSQALLHITAHTKETLDSISAFKLGDCVQVRGLLSVFHGEPRINALEIYKLSRTLEINRICEMELLYKSLYDTLPSEADTSDRLDMLLADFAS